MSDKKPQQWDLVKDMSKKIESHLAYDGESRQITVTSGAVEEAIDVYNKHNSDHTVSTKQIKDTLDAVRVFSAASGLATGTVAVDVLKEHKDLDSTSATFNLTSRDTITHTVQREHTVVNAFDKDAAPQTKHGHLTTVWKFSGAKASGSALNRTTRDEVADLGSKKLK